MQRIKQSDPRAVERRVYFVCLNALNMQDRLQSSDMGTVTVKVQKNGAGAVATSTNTATQCDATDAKGEFFIELTTTEINTPGKVNLKISSTGGTKQMDPVEIVVQIDRAIFVTVAGATLTTTAFTSDRTGDIANQWKNSMLVGISGANADAGGKKIDAFAPGSSGLFTLKSTTPLAVNPIVGDVFEIVNR